MLLKEAKFVTTTFFYYFQSTKPLPSIDSGEDSGPPDVADSTSLVSAESGFCSGSMNESSFQEHQSDEISEHEVLKEKQSPLADVQSEEKCMGEVSVLTDVIEPSDVHGMVN